MESLVMRKYPAGFGKEAYVSLTGTATLVHALIKGDRKKAIIGGLLTIILAIVFTALQYIEYFNATFTITDSVFGTTFYASTGLHGLTKMAPTKINIKNSVKIRKVHYTTYESKTPSDTRRS